jgi:signal transduction histidine kinase
MNILSNAIDALEVSVVSGQWSVVNELTTDNGQWTTDKTPMIRIRTEVVEQNWVVIRIADNGLGLTAEVQPKIFDPFFTTKPVGKGTGLGLSISYQIVVDKHRGQLTCHSIPGQGAEFVIKLPIALVYSTPRQRVLVNAIAQDRTFDKVTETASRKSKVKS